MDAIGGGLQGCIPDELVAGAHDCWSSGPSTLCAHAGDRELPGWSGFDPDAAPAPRVDVHYKSRTSRVLIYDFLMPLTHEAPLRRALDALFFRDTLVARLRALPKEQLEEVFPRAPEQGDWDHLERVLDFVQERFAGYSITHCSGRSRFGPLLSQGQVSEFERQGARYLADETTAVTRFIFPYADEGELRRIRYLFDALFVRSIVGIVKGENQIWVIETGPEHLIHIWSGFERYPQ